jgi:hypothetical protein
MSRIAHNSCRTLAVALSLLAGAAAADAQVVVVEGGPPAVTYHQTVIPAVAYGVPTVSYYTPRVAYTTVPSVSYYAPSVSYYAAPAVSVYPGTVSTTRYGILGRPRWTTRYPATYVVP